MILPVTISPGWAGIWFNDNMNFKAVSHILMRIMVISAISLLACVPVAILYREPATPFIYSALTASALAGFLFLFGGKLPGLDSFTRREAYLSVSFSWLIISLIGAIPYLISGAIPNLTDAVFESVSGFTTTGSSILTDIESLPKSILFWRSTTHWIGGLGIIVLVIVIMPSLNIGGYNLFTLESSFQEKIQPKIKSVGRRLLYIYLVLSLSETLLLLAGGMNLFESVCHTFGTVATGGFSPKNTSIGGYSPYIQYIVMIFMMLSGMNFVIHYYLVKREFKKIRQNEELKFYLLVIFLSGFIITGILYFQTDRSFEPAFRESFFQVISIITCTGYASADYLLWPAFGAVLIFMLMFFGGSTGSTAGGIKMARHLVSIKNSYRSFRLMISPNAIIPLRINNRSMSTDENNGILTFILWYFFIFVLGSMLLIFFGNDLATAGSSVATAMGGIGPGFGTVGPASNFAHLSEASKVTMGFLMILGRLEIYTVIMLFTPWFWKN
ncbi:TrkH family potassium uptake protein [Gaoshiqia sp. Z1-71]|uniref:TrkH family potassium uptake protein n=1 Tax=Gaoshiqia hydrogeniformans TaxID=3290090 RepID=UPI003BF90998